MSKYIKIYLTYDIYNVIRNYLLPNKNHIKQLYKSVLFNANIDMINSQYEYFKIKNNIISITNLTDKTVMISYKNGIWCKYINNIPLSDIVKYNGTDYSIQLWKNNYKASINFKLI